MADPIETLEAYAADLITRLQPDERRQLTAEIARRLRPSQQQRIASQRNPDGTVYAERKQQLRRKKGKIKRQMFSKLRTARYLKSSSTADEAIIAFTEAVSRIARVHQLGLRDRVNRSGLEVTYPARQLLGFSPADHDLIAELVTAHLADRL